MPNCVIVYSVLLQSFQNGEGFKAMKLCISPNLFWMYENTPHFEVIEVIALKKKYTQLGIYNTHKMPLKSKSWSSHDFWDITYHVKTQTDRHVDD